jgi:excisionase family DNA binding protein
VKLKPNPDMKVVERFVEEWTLSKIIDTCGGRKLKSANPEDQVENPPSGSSSSADNNLSEADAEKPKPKFLRIDTFRQNAKRLGFASAKILESFKRLNPDDYAKAKEHIENATQLAAIDRVLDGTSEPARPERRGPLLLKMGEAAELLGVSRPTLWRMLNVGRLSRVEILPKTYRVRRDELEQLVFGEQTG